MGRILRDRRWRAVACSVAAAVAVAAACQPVVTPLDPSLGAAIVTSDGTDTYGLTLSDGVVTATAARANEGENTRVVFWRAANQDIADQESCATWVDTPTDRQQPGAALRVRTVRGRTKAITVTNNIYFGARWGFNVHVMDSGASEPFHKIGGFELTEIFRPGGPGTFDVPPFPWRMCARAVGDTVSFIVWPTSQPKPAWNDARYGGSVTLPAGWDQPGKPGWYIGHLKAGQRSSFADLTVTGLPSSGPAARDTAATDLSAPAPPPRPPTWIAESP
jgi:hypothetical protein